MSKTLRLMGVFAHPDDESMGAGGLLAKYGNEGVETYLVTATRGERGWFGEEKDYPGPDALGEIRERELCAAAKTLGVHDVAFLDYVDGDLDRAEPAEVISKIAAHIRRVRPHVVVTFDPNGAYGHPDHIAICQFATAAIVAAAQPANGVSPHRVDKLYYLTETRQKAEMYESAFGDLVMTIDGIERGMVTWQDWAVTTRLDTSPYWRQVWEAISCHRSQLPGYKDLIELPERTHRLLWSSQELYRAFSLVNGGREVERDLFAGLR